jgi:hypothetical protein
MPEWVPSSAHPAVVWKSIESTTRLGLFATLAPQAKFVHVLRHPCGYANSIMQGMKAGRFEHAHDPAHDVPVWTKLLRAAAPHRRVLPLEAYAKMAPSEQLAWRWVLENEKAMRDAQGLKNCIAFRYEDLCRAGSAEPRRMFAFVGLEWDAQVQHYIDTSTRGDDSGYYSVFKDSETATQRWRTDLAQSDIDRVLAVTNDSLPGKLYAESAASATASSSAA